MKPLLQTTNYKLQTIRGAAVLPVVLIVSAIIMEVAVTSVLVANVFGNTTFNSRIASEALATAEAGAQDATIKVIRSCPIGSVTLPGNSGCADYSVAVGPRTATVIIRNVCDSDNNGLKDNINNCGGDNSTTPVDGNKIIISKTSILGRVKRVEVRLTIDQATGKTDTKSFKECYNWSEVNQACL